MEDVFPEEADLNTSSENAENYAEKDGPLLTNEDELKAVIKDVEQPDCRDRYNLVYIILLIHGVGVLMPWNMFINANGYFVNHKLKDTREDGTIKTETRLYRDYFLSWLGLVAQMTNVLFAAVNLFCQFKRGSATARIVVCIIVILVMFVLTTVLAMLDSETWQGQFFWITMVSVVIINVANGIYQNSIYGIAAFLPFKYTNAVVIGLNLSGLVTSIIALIAEAATPDHRTSGIYYFLMAIFVLLVAFDSYFMLPLLPFFKHHVKVASESRREFVDEEEESYLTKYLIVIKKCWVHLVSAFLVFFVTLTCFPAIEAGIEAVNPNFMPANYFPLVTCFLFFNLFAVMGSFLAEFIRKPGPKYVWIPVLLRFLFIPFFLLCNFRPKRRNIPVWFSNDYVYCAGSILMALSSGYFTSLCMMYIPGNVKEKYKGIAGMMGAFCLISGVFCGIIFTFPLIYAIEKNGGLAPDIGNGTTNSSYASFLLSTSTYELTTFDTMT